MTQLTSSPDAVHLTFSDGETYDAQFVFGADGTSSSVRRLLLGDDAAKARKTGMMFATGIVSDGDIAKTKRIVDAHPVAAIAMGTHAVAGCGGMV